MGVVYIDRVTWLLKNNIAELYEEDQEWKSLFI